MTTVSESLFAVARRTPLLTLGAFYNVTGGALTYADWIFVRVFTR